MAVVRGAEAELANQDLDTGKCRSILMFIVGLRCVQAPTAERLALPPSMLDWRERLVCSQCGSRKVDMVVTGTERR